MEDSYFHNDFLMRGVYETHCRQHGVMIDRITRNYVYLSETVDETGVDFIVDRHYDEWLLRITGFVLHRYKGVYV